LPQLFRFLSVYYTLSYMLVMMKIYCDTHGDSIKTRWANNVLNNEF